MPTWKDERLCDLAEGCANRSSGAKIGFESVLGLSVLEAVVVRERVRSDLLAGDLSDAVKERGPVVKRVAPLVLADLVEERIGVEVTLSIRRTKLRQVVQEVTLVASK